MKELYKLFKESKGVSTDTRRIDPGVMFFALKGANFNGNEFAGKALEAGASCVVIDEAAHKIDDRCILVQDVLTTLQQLALHHRRQFTIPFIAITGSNGKTTTKELVHAVLSTTYRTHATVGNLNNHIGIPLTLLSIPEKTEMAVIEMGANHQKEIESYCLFTEPTHGIITNIGKAHLEGFGGQEGVKKGKGELFDYLLKSGGNAFINTSSETIRGMSKFDNPITYPQKKDFYSCDMIGSTPFVIFQAEDGAVHETHLTGDYNFDNIATALCVAKFFGVKADLANRAVADYLPQNNRSQFVKKGSNEILLDAYNANPSSMKAAIENFERLPVKYKWIILGDMFELGEESEAEHAALGTLLASCHFNLVILCGKNMRHAALQFKEVLYFETKPDLISYLRNHKPDHTSILIKGSRGMGLETIVEYL